MVKRDLKTKSNERYKHFVCSSPKLLTASGLKTLIDVAEKVIAEILGAEVGKLLEDGFEKGPAPYHRGTRTYQLLCFPFQLCYPAKRKNLCSLRPY